MVQPSPSNETSSIRPFGADFGEHLHAVRTARVAARLIDIGVRKRAPVARIIIVIYEKFNGFLAIHTHRMRPFLAIFLYLNLLP